MSRLYCTSTYFSEVYIITNNRAKLCTIRHLFLALFDKTFSLSFYYWYTANEKYYKVVVYKTVNKIANKI